ncbi:MAG: hypothetical protein IJB31_09145 [Akkermansia sp.]|nr:hypothetical protein [Akkermansia sp.]
MNTKKEVLLEQYKRELSELEKKTDSYPDLIDFTVEFAMKHKLDANDMAAVIPQDMLECCVPTVLDMIAATDEFPVE